MLWMLFSGSPQLGTTRNQLFAKLVPMIGNHSEPSGVSPSQTVPGAGNQLGTNSRGASRRMVPARAPYVVGAREPVRSAGTGTDRNTDRVPITAPGGGLADRSGDLALHDRHDDEVVAPITPLAAIDRLAQKTSRARDRGEE